MKSLDEFAQTKLRELESKQLRRRLANTDPIGRTAVVHEGQRLISFCSNDYLNLSQHPEVKRAAIEAMERFGVGAGASRLITGNHSLFQELEERLARFKGAEAACVFGSGYLTNLGVIPVLVGEGDLILLDELCHACIHAGAGLSAAQSERFRHNDASHVAALLESRRAEHRHSLILTEGVFSMDGDLAPLPELTALADRFDAWLMTDDAHGFGVLGGGRGSSFAHGPGVHVPLQMGTLSKAVGSYGGYLCASQPVIDLVRTRARPFIYSTGLPAGLVAASIAALDLIERDPEYTTIPLAKARRFSAGVGLLEAQSCIVPVVLGDAERALAAASTLAKHGYLVTAIRPPTVPQGTARLRFTFTAGHRDPDVDRLAEIVRKEVLGGA